MVTNETVNQVMRSKGPEQNVVEMFESLIHGIAEGIIIFNERGIIEEWNQSAISMFGISRPDAINHAVWDILPGIIPPAIRISTDDSDEIPDVILDIVKIKKDSRAEFRLRTASGQFMWIERRLSILNFDRSFKVLALISDITSRKREEQQISERNKQLEILNEIILQSNQADSLDGLFRSVLHATVRLMNFECGAIYHIPAQSGKAVMKHHYALPDEIVLQMDSLALDSPMFKSVFHDLTPLYLENANETLQIGGIRSLVLIPLVDDDQSIGALLICSLQRHQFSKQEQELLRVIGQELVSISRKIVLIDKYKQTEQALRRSESRYRNVVDNANDAIYIIENNRFTYVNKQFEKVFGYDAAEIYSGKLKPLDIVAPESHAFIAERARAKHDGKAVSPRYEYKAITRSGQIIDADVNTFVLVDGENSRIMGILRDITDRKNLEEQLRIAQKMEGIGQLAGGIAHDFNNLLTGIIGNLDLLELDLSQNDAQIELIEEAKTAADRAVNLTRQLLTFSKQTKPVLSPVKINQIIEELRVFLAETFDRRINLTADLDENIDLVSGDRSAIYQMLLNLCINSRDSIMEILEGNNPRWQQYRKDRYYIHIQTRNVNISEAMTHKNVNAKTGPHVELSVKDNGSGISRDILQRIFEPFFSTKEIGKGTGLGLSTVYGIVQQHRGWVDVTSSEGRGTTFAIYMPRLTTDIQTIKTEEVGVAEHPSDGTILVVDDEQVIRNLGKRLLERRGYSVLVAKDGEEALHTFRDHMQEINLVILDLTMPKLSGREVLARMLDMQPDAKIILTSGFTGAENETDFKSIGALDFLPKPYQFPDLLARIKKIMQQSKS
ncbi:PAS domain S-box protein [candidate division KSB1 bacterium]|nr:PAS domain S-box protein [candidate division KSB1 bacterium]